MSNINKKELISFLENIKLKDFLLVEDIERSSINSTKFGLLIKLKILIPKTTNEMEAYLKTINVISLLPLYKINKNKLFYYLKLFKNKNE